jgi:hypothetical protein
MCVTLLAITEKRLAAATTRVAQDAWEHSHCLHAQKILQITFLQMVNGAIKPIFHVLMDEA